MIQDESIIGLFFERSENAIKELDTKYGKVFYHLSYNILASREDSEECVNDAYLGAWNAIPPAKPNPLLTYVCKIVRNLSLKAYYKKEAAKRKSSYTVAMEEMEVYLASPASVEHQVEMNDLTECIEAFLDRQTLENRVIFMRRYWFSDSIKDISERVGLSEKTISVRLTRMRAKLRDDLSEKGVLI